MPKLVCPNGHVLDLSAVPAPGEFYYESTEKWDETVDRVAHAVSPLATSDRRILAEAISDALAGAVKHFYKCGICGALSFPSEQPPVGYVRHPLGVHRQTP
jgi:hypothetical protein